MRKILQKQIRILVAALGVCFVVVTVCNAWDVPDKWTLLINIAASAIVGTIMGYTEG